MEYQMAFTDEKCVDWKKWPERKVTKLTGEKPGNRIKLGKFIKILLKTITFLFINYTAWYRKSMTSEKNPETN